MPINEHIKQQHTLRNYNLNNPFDHSIIPHFTCSLPPYLLCEVCVFTRCLHGFSLGTQTSSRISKTRFLGSWWWTIRSRSICCTPTASIPQALLYLRIDSENVRINSESFTFALLCIESKNFSQPTLFRQVVPKQWHVCLSTETCCYSEQVAQ